MVHTTIIEIDTAQFISNLKAIRNQLGNPSVKLCLPVKANAYGHGLIKMSKTAESYVDYLAVSCLDEGILLRQNGITKPILVFGAFNKDEIEGLIANQLEITVSSQYKANLLAEHCNNTGQTCRVHLKIDTGMNRIGVKMESAKGLFDCVLSHKNLSITGVYSHFASSESDDKSTTLEQISKFEQITKYAKSINPKIICHIANSGGLCYYPNSYFDMIRLEYLVMATSLIML